MKKYCLVIVLQILLSLVTQAQTSVSPLTTSDPIAQNRWVDSLYNTMTLKEKIGQLFMVQVFSNQDEATKQLIINQIKDHAIGGLIYSKGGPKRQAQLNNDLQSISKIPLLIGIDAEWGLSMRLDSTYAFPWNMTLGAISDLKLIEQTGTHIGDHCKRLGIHFNFAPVVDINTNPQNPIIGNRSFGENKYNVTQKALAFMKGMHSRGVLANAKHFPGHGDTSKDSHKTLPTIKFNKKRIDSVELYPYKALIAEGLSSVMVAHLNVPSLESRLNYPSSLSYPIVTSLLKHKLNFKGLIFTDALQMKGTSDFDKSAAIDLNAFLAGNDVLLMSSHLEEGIKSLIKAYKRKKISETRLAHSVKKILTAKYKVGLNDYKPIDLNNLDDDLNRVQDIALHEQLIASALTVIKRDSVSFPIKTIHSSPIAYVKMGTDSSDVFLKTLNNYAKVDKVDSENLEDLLQKLIPYETVIIGLHQSNTTPWKPYKFSKKELHWINEVAQSKTIILDIFAKPYALNAIEDFDAIETIVVSYQNSSIAQSKSAQLIFGALSAKGTLPVSAGYQFSAGTGIETPLLQRLSYGAPETVDMDTQRLTKIDSIVNYSIKEKIIPGAQVVVARKGKVVYEKSYGYHTYDSIIPVQDNSIYDVASLTKILVTLPLIMELYEANELNLDSTLGELIPDYKNTNKSTLTLKAILSHYASLKPWIPFYKATIDTIANTPKPLFYKSKPSQKFSIQVAEQLYLRNDYSDSIYDKIKFSELLPQKEFYYSDLPYYILKTYLENYYKTSLSTIIQKRFYEPLGANYSTYLPLEKFPKNQITPSEIDDYFRLQVLQGHVHDMGAAMQNGIGGHAGLFSTANDVAKLMQLYLQNGSYGGQHYFDSSTMAAFNKCYYCEDDVHRGVGFNKPQLEGEGPTCGCVSMASFGHSGFTGPYAWADPKEEIIYVFMTNRTYPNAKVNRLSKENIRTEIQRLIYEAIND